MKSLSVPALLLLVSMSPGIARAQLTVEDGIWGDPSQSGSGFVIELQDNVMAVAAFAYDSAGRATWFLASGAYSNGRFSSSLTLFAGGQCLGCTYVPASISSSPGTVTIDFASTNVGVVSFNGVPRYQIRRSYFAFGHPDDLVLGAWSAVFPIPGTADVAGTFPLLNQKVTFTDGTQGVVGRLGDTSRLVSGYYNSSAGEYFLLADVDEEFFIAYLFTGIGKDTWYGDAYLYPKSTGPAGVPGVPFYGARIAGRSQVQALFPPTKLLPPSLSLTDWARIDRSLRSQHEAESEKILTLDQSTIFEKLAAEIGRRRP